MSRLTIAALALASAVGGAGGALVATHAVVPPADDVTASDSPQDDTTRDGGGKGNKGNKGGTDEYDDPTGPDPDGPLFYFADGAIHDGDQTVAVPTVAAEDVQTLARVSGGWLLVEGAADTGDAASAAALRGTFVSTEGVVWVVDEWVGAWDIGPAGERMMFWNDGRFWVADFVSRTVTDLNLVEGAGEELDFMTSYDAAPWVRIAGADVLTVWGSRDGGRLVLTETEGFTHTAVGPPAVAEPATSPGGVLVVADTAEDLYGGDAPCLTGGELRAPSDEWWRNCDVVREDVISPYSPDGVRLLAVDVASASTDPTGYTVLDAETGEPVARWAAPEGAVDASWSADTTVTVVVRGDAGDAVLWQCGTGGICEEALELPGINPDDVVLGTP